MNNSLFDLSGKIALITGSSQGLGLTIARGLAENGATVVLNGRKWEKLNTAVTALKKKGHQVFGSCFDVRDANQIAREVALVESEIGPISILVNNAGITVRNPLESFAEADWRQILDVNLTGAFLTAKQVVKGMIRRKLGKIINICSMQSELGRPTITPYAASKGGLKMLTKGMATEWAQYNIQVNGIGPGYFETELTKPLIENKEFDTWLRARVPANRWGKPEELIGAATFLASRASQYVTGQILYVDGGMLACV